MSTSFKGASLVAQLVKKSSCNVGDTGLIPGLGRSPGEGNGNTLQYPSLENPHGQRSLVGYSPWGHKVLDSTKPSSSWSCLAMRGTGVELLKATLPSHEESLPGNGAQVRKAERRDTLVVSLERPDSAAPEAVLGLKLPRGVN